MTTSAIELAGLRATNYKIADNMSQAKANVDSDILKAKYAEQNRINTYKVLAKYRKRNMLMFSGLLASVCGIYAYSMFAVRQEDFADFEK